ncbi:DUF364 domain-containing protein [Nitrogeniibacter mangrovi]|uniref:DUF364 domain-containing protein n=1 Tax=Nitrogeniibacter mangrovi TaxID=2016596 RepID=A0A6C1B5B5_9RHOO|nr:DUF364 domain-containing protein [Nitrogeniibacter mangrovi]QID17480.1 DUF364 domain-containing protein [Nitrogeniibacter mangrovi]
MSFATDILELLSPYAGALPRVRALHLPPVDKAQGKDGEFCAIELEDGALGLSYVLLDDTLRRLMAARGGLGVEGMDAFALARAFADGEGVHRTLGFAAINAISRHLFDRVGYVAPDSVDSVGGLDPQSGDHVGMIGFFCPLAERIVATGASLTVVELKAELEGARDGYVVTTDPSALRGCNKVLSTSTILLNDTLERMLADCAGAQRFAMIGPGAGCLPDPLFARGVTSFGGTWIEDRAAFVDALVTGEGWTRYARKSAITPADYPGWASLKTRLSA